MYDLKKERPVFEKQVRNLWELVPGKEYYLVHDHIKDRIIFLGHYQLGKFDIWPNFQTCFWVKYVELELEDYEFASDHSLEPYDTGYWNGSNCVANI